MRSAFVKKVTELMERDRSIYLLTADTGFKIFDDLKTTFPERFLNVGIAESSMIGVACGLALNGMSVFVYGIASFITMRCFEQIRIDLCFHNLPVKLIGIGGGLTYAGEGMTHHSIEDIAIMSSLPNMSVVCPGDPVEVERALAASMELKGPVYLRLGKSGERVIHEKGIDSFVIGKGIRLYEGSGFAIIATGNMLESAVALRDLLKGKGINPEVVSIHTVKPMDEELIGIVSQKCTTLVVLEEHSYRGGLGAAIASLIARKGYRVRLKHYAIPDTYASEAGSQSYMRRQYGLIPECIAEDLLKEG